MQLGFTRRLSLASATGIAVVVGIGGIAWWGKNKIQELAGPAAESVERIAELEKKANQNPFTRPADGVVSEDRLLKFIEEHATLREDGRLATERLTQQEIAARIGDLAVAAE